MAADWKLEEEAGALTGSIIIGVDEVGRGPLAGPVVAAAAWLDLNNCPLSVLALLQDSKSLNQTSRSKALEAVQPYLISARGRAEVEEIDAVNILQATMRAMTRAVEALVPKLPHAPAKILIDGNRIPPLRFAAEAIVKGDSKSVSIAAASIVAKQARDAEMEALASDYPGYGWERNAGYGTAEHRQAIHKLGPTPHHRMSFQPLKQMALELKD